MPDPVKFPTIKSSSSCQYSYSGLFELFSCQKDVFYRFMEQDGIDWRKLQVVAVIADLFSADKEENGIILLVKLEPVTIRNFPERSF